MKFLLIALGVMILIGAISLLADRLVSAMAFFPEPGVQIDPAAFQVPIETVYLESEDDVRISGFFLPREDSRRAVLFLHGNAGNASHRLPDAVGLWSLGVNVLLLDYRGYGLSEGRPSEKGVYRDGEAGLSYLVEERGFALSDVVIFGRSIGSAVAIDIAQGKDLAGLILVSPLSSGRAIARSQGLGWAMPLLGDPFNSVSKLAKVKSPLIVIHGDQDQILPSSMGREIYASAPSGRGFFLIPGAGHNDLIERSEGRFFEHVRDFLIAITEG